jgi:1,4-dihydroxy-2-naphthoate octaprenyltransferase
MRAGRAVCAEARNNLLKVLVRSTRPAFLLLTLVCVFLGFSTALATAASVDTLTLILALTGALLAHVSVNTLNEYLDFRNGLDLKTTRTAFSGGSGALPAHPELAPAVLVLALVTLAITVIIGGYLAWRRGAAVLLLGLAGVVLIITYTRWLNRSPLLCLIAPGLGFGLLMVVGTHVVLTGTHSAFIWLIALVPFFLVSNLLLLNQYPDCDADASVGRRHFPIVFGLRASNFTYATFGAAAYATIVFLILGGHLPAKGWMAIIPAPLSALSLIGAVKHGKRIGAHPHYLAANAAAALLTPFLIGVALLTAD